MPDFELVIRRRVTQEAVVTIYDVIDADHAVDEFNDTYDDGFPNEDAFYTYDSNGWPEVIQVVEKK
jgi:hypothetical protein